MMAARSVLRSLEALRDRDWDSVVPLIWPFSIAPSKAKRVDVLSKWVCTFTTDLDELIKDANELRHLLHTEKERVERVRNTVLQEVASLTDEETGFLVLLWSGLGSNHHYTRPSFAEILRLCDNLAGFWERTLTYIIATAHRLEERRATVQDVRAACAASGSPGQQLGLEDQIGSIEGMVAQVEAIVKYGNSEEGRK